MTSTDPTFPPGLGTLVDEKQDKELARMFALRERLDDDAFLAQWESSPASTARVIMHPASPQALLRYTIAIEAPQRIERRFLFCVHVFSSQLAGLQHPGTHIWLIPQHIAENTPSTPTNAYELISHCLPIGSVTKPLAALEKALTTSATTPHTKLNECSRTSGWGCP